MEAYQEKCLLLRKKLHTTVYSQVFSPCGKFLAVCTNFGNIALFNIQNALSPDSTDIKKPFFSFKAHNGAIYSLTSTDKHLISAGSDNIVGWNWADVTTKAPKQVWALNVPTQNRFDVPETNSVVADVQDGMSRLYAGCGDNNVHVWDLETGQQLVTLRGHTDYIHEVVVRPNTLDCVSASEDGSVRIWDTRSPKEPISIIEPYKNEICARPHLGKWLGCVSLDAADDWLICGGGPHLSLWHLRSMHMTTTFEANNMSHQHVMFHDDAIISGGTQPNVYHWSMNGDLRSKVPCTPTSVFNISINNHTQNNRVLTVVGSTYHVDVCTNFGYKAFSLSVV